MSSELLPAAAVSAAATAAAVVATSLGLVDPDRPSVQLGAVECGAGCLGSRLLGEGHEAEAAGAAGVPIGDHGRLGDLTECRERIVQALVRGVPAQVSDKKLLVHALSSISVRLSRVLAASRRSCRNRRVSTCTPALLWRTSVRRCSPAHHTGAPPSARKIQQSRQECKSSTAEGQLKAGDAEEIGLPRSIPTMSFESLKVEKSE